MLVMDTQSNGSRTVADRIAAKQARIAERIEELAAEYTGARSMLADIASLLDFARFGRPADARKSAANSAARLLKLLPRKVKPIPTLAELLGDETADD
jgi:hypothetical protein